MSKDNKEKEVKMDQDGKMINPHNPEFITKVPWYLGNSGPTLKHHSIQKRDHFLSLAESDELIRSKIDAQKSTVQTAAKTVYRKGACKNCGAMTHKEKDCVERPRSAKKAAWKSGLDIAPDEVSLNLEHHGKVSYSAKRDQWKGYNPAEYQDIIEKHNRVEVEKRKLKREAKEKKKQDDELRHKAKKEEKMKKKEKKLSAKSKETEEDLDDKEKTTASDGLSDGEDDEENDEKEFIERDDSGIGGNGMRVTVRNLRLREDTPKYLRNLALDSAFYDPKSRSMRLNPLPDENPEDLVFAGDNFVRHSGDALKLAANQGESIDVISNPSQAELLQREFVQKKKALLDKYLDGKMNESLDPRLRLGQTESYIEYGQDGRPVKGAAVTHVVPKTKYEEDVYINNHTSVWGSYYNRNRQCWGYQCCHSLLRNSYCTGVVGRETNDAANNQAIDSFQAKKMAEKLNQPIVTATITKRVDLFGESSVSTSAQLDDKKLQAALSKQDSSSSSSSTTKRGFNSMTSVEMTLEDMEAYRLKRVKEDDPMAKLLDSDTLLEYNPRQ
eukprot:gene25620-34188_t